MKRHINMNDEEKDFFKRTLDAKVRQEVKNFSRNGLIPRTLIHPLAVKSLPTVSTTSDGQEFVSLSAAWSSHSKLDKFAILDYDLMRLQTSQLSDNRNDTERAIDEQ